MEHGKGWAIYPRSEYGFDENKGGENPFHTGCEQSRGISQGDISGLEVEASTLEEKENRIIKL